MWAQTLPPARRDTCEASVRWMDGFWAPDLHLLRFPSAPDTLHSVLHTCWYALGLLMRAGSGDIERATAALEEALRHQYVEPGAVYHGSFARFAEEPPPPPDATMWIEYDPNWREFVGTTLAVIRSTFSDDLPAPLIAQIDEAIAHAVAGCPQGWPPANYSNIALMRAWLDAWEGTRTGDRTLLERGEALAREVHRLFSRNETFEEYNSPTYYGVDLYALALWRDLGTEPLRTLGPQIEEALWRDVARFYHPGMRTLCGPYDRAYGMDMRRHIGLLGLWMWAGLGHDDAPVPDLTQPFEHAHDLCMGPLVALLGPRIPADVDLRAHTGDRLVERLVTDEPRRVATAWVTERVMVGAQDASATKGFWDQYHPATIHWLTPSSDVGWIRLRHPGVADARAIRGALEISCRRDAPGETVFEIFVPGAQHGTLDPLWWGFPGLTVEVETDAPGSAKTVPGPGGMIAVHFQQAADPATWSSFHLHLTPNP